MNSFENKRIYCVVADTVQHPIDQHLVKVTDSFPPKSTYCRAPADALYKTRDIVQPAGRLIAQAAHVVSKVRHYMLFEDMCKEMAEVPKKRKVGTSVREWEFQFEPITTIILSARDSFELQHVHDLLLNAKIQTYHFHDTNTEAYGSGLVKTAIATEPINAAAIIGILDYLPLWAQNSP